MLRFAQHDMNAEALMTLEILRLEGMRGERDRRAILDAVRALPGVRRATASLSDHTLRVEREDTASLAAILQAVRRVGYSASVLA
jgi:copper chaperone CopZ